MYYIAAATAIIMNFCYLHFFYSNHNNAKKKLEQTLIELKDSIKTAQKRKILLEKVSHQAAFSTLSKGIAHEIRNPMASMLTRTEIVENNIQDTFAVQKFADTIKVNIKRILNITDTMLKYGNPISNTKQTVNLNTIIQEVLYLIEGDCHKKGIRVIFEAEKHAPLKGHPSGLYQVIFNITMNAIEALPSGGEIRIKTQKCRFITKLGTEASGCQVSISDNGKGINKDTLKHIYDPFFTTKYKNTGLGLSTSLNIIDQHNGTIEIETVEKMGTLFKVCIPQTD